MFAFLVDLFLRGVQIGKERTAPSARDIATPGGGGVDVRRMVREKIATMQGAFKNTAVRGAGQNKMCDGLRFMCDEQNKRDSC